MKRFCFSLTDDDIKIVKALSERTDIPIAAILRKSLRESADPETERLIERVTAQAASILAFLERLTPDARRAVASDGDLAQLRGIAGMTKSATGPRFAVTKQLINEPATAHKSAPAPAATSGKRFAAARLLDSEVNR